MHPIALAACFGALKGLTQPVQPPANSFFAGPLAEEVAFRAVPAKLGIAGEIAAIGFGLAHPAPASFVDAFLGGLIYQAAYKRSGFFGALAAHVVHNVASAAAGAAVRGVPWTVD